MAKPKKSKKKDKKAKKGAKGQNEPVIEDAMEIKSYEPVKIKCPFCKRDITTKVVYSQERGNMGRCCMRCCACAFPWCLRKSGAYRDAQHSCPRCKKVIARNSW